MNQQNIAKQPLLNAKALINSLGIWLLVWSALVLFVTYQGQPGVACLTPMAWLLAQSRPIWWPSALEGPWGAR